MADTLDRALLEAALLSSLSEEDKKSLVILPKFRTIIVPEGFFFGVYNDKDVLKVPFIIPRYYEDNDFSEFNIQINYLNSAKYGNVYYVPQEDITVDEDYVRFNWVVGRGVFAKEGTVIFIVCLRVLDETNKVIKEFNTTLARASVLEGLEVDENPDPVTYSILANIRDMTEEVVASTNEAKQAAREAKASLRQAERELTAFVGAPLVASTAADMLDITKIYVYTGSETGYENGYWYYHNGTAWTAGGAYNATVYQTDSTLSTSGMPADAQATGDVLATKVDGAELSNGYLQLKSGQSDVGDGIGPFLTETDSTLVLPGVAADAKAVGNKLATKIDGARLTQNGLLYLRVGNQDVVGPLGPFSSASGGGGLDVIDTWPSEPDTNKAYVLNDSGSLVLYVYADDEWKSVGISPSDIESITDGFVYDINETSSGISIIYGDGTTKNVTTKDSSVVVEDGEALEGNAGIRLLYTDGSSKDIAISGGGGSSTSGSASITRVTPTSSQCVYGDSFNIQYLFNAYDAAGDRVGDATATWYVGNVRRATSTARQEVTNSFDIGPYLTSGSNTIKLSISVDTGGDTPTVTTKTWSINAIRLYAIWDYDDSTINSGSTVTLRWTPYGDLEKTTHFIIDGVERIDLKSTTSRSGSQQTVTFDALSHGAHMVEMYLTATVNSETITSQSIFHDMVFNDGESTTPVVASSFSQSTMIQYNTVQIPFVVFDPSRTATTVVLKENGDTVATLTNVPRTLQHWIYTPHTYGDKTLTITCGVTTKTIELAVEELDIDNEEVGGYTFRLKASDFASNSALEEWESNGITATFSQNFDWTNGGIKTEIDEDGNIRQLVLIKAGTRMTINHKLFSDDPTVYGKTFKMIFKVTNCREYDADVATCYSGGIGIQMSAHEAAFSSTNTTISVPYGEDEYIELEFDIYPAPTPTNGSYRYMMAWIDGVITTCRVYGISDSFTQANANQQYLTIGSDDCDVCIYMVKAYSNYMTRDNHIENFIADAPNAQEMVKRFDRNDILDANGGIDYEKLVTQNPDCRVWLYDIPYLTVGKKDKVKNCLFNQFWYNGDQYYELTGTGTMTVQGTSSVDYILGAANTDISFTSLTDGYGNNLMVDGVVDEDHYGKNYFVGENDEVTVFNVTNNAELTPDCIPVERDNAGNVTKYIKALGYKINDDSCPITYSNTKVNFASCEQVNNMCNAIWYQRFQPYQSLTPRDCMEFSMGVQFIKDSGSVPDNDHFVLFGDNKYHMYSIANMGTSKKNVHVFHDLSNENECCIEVNNNLNDLCRMVTDDMTNLDWSGKIEGKDHSFGMRYPDVSEPSAAIKSGWQRFVSWMAHSNPSAATNLTLTMPETYGSYTFRGHSRSGSQVLRGTTVTAYAGTYTTDSFNRRMAKMLSECEDYLVMDSVVYHFVYLERHTMVDNVSKNSFWSSSDLLHWDLSKAYDMDTSDGNNNEGQMVFDYGNEANDVIGTKTVFNANDSVWFVFVSNLYEACQTMFTNREAAGAWSATAYHNFLLSEQQKVPERCWIQCYWYDYLRTYEQEINDSWMTFLDGGQKTHQRWHYEYFEEIYDASKYRGTSCTVQNVNFRGYYPTRWSGLTNAEWEALEPEAEIHLKMYNKCYINVSIDGAIYQTKAERGQTYTIDFSNQANLNDTVINIYSASMIEEIGDISRLYPGTPNFANATRLRSLTIGSSTTGYKNSNLTSITLGNNKMLEYLYAQNLAYVTTNLVLTNCQSLLYLDASGSSFTGYEFATGGLLSTAYIESPTALIMRGLIYLTDENFHVTSYDNLLTLVIENCTGIDSLDIVEEADNLAVVRLTDINWTVADTTILNTLLTLQGRDEADHTISESVLTGEVYISGAIRTQEIDSYDEQWPNLSVTYDSSNLVSSYLVTYVNADTNHTVLYQTYVDRGDTPPNPYALGLIQLPTLAETDQYAYTFSGWDDITSAVLSSRTVTATYTATVRTYTVKWYSRPGSAVLYQNTFEYGSDAVYVGDLPTRTDEESYYVVNSFKGWDKSTGYVKGNMDVYAEWDRSEPPASGTDLSAMTRGEINAIATFKTASTYLEVKDYFDLTLGFNPTFSNVNEQTILQNRFFDGTEYYDTNIKLFSENTPSFTLAFDYEFLSSTVLDGVLAGCCEEDGQEGFKLRWASSNPYFHWGDRNVQAGYADARNLIVIRHIGGTRRMYAYVWNKTSTYDSQITVAELVRTRETSTEQTLIFGAMKYLDDNSFDLYASGWIYWCKIWWDDLGDTVCRKIASWPRETMRVHFAGSNRYHLAGQTSERAHLSFIPNAPLSFLRRMNSSNTNVGGWNAAELRTFFNTRMYEAFDYGWQSLIKTVRINASAGNTSTEILTSEDKIYLASRQEATTSSLSSPYTDEGTPIAFFTDIESRLKFPGVIIPEGAQIITEGSDPTEMLTYTVSEGDIWVNTSNQRIGYIYISSTNKNKHSRIGNRANTSSDNIQASDGGLWFRAYAWWLRSPDVASATDFSVVNYAGYLYANGASYTFGLVPCFSI